MIVMYLYNKLNCTERISILWGRGVCEQTTKHKHVFLDRSVVKAFAHGAMGRRIDPSW